MAAKQKRQFSICLTPDEYSAVSGAAAKDRITMSALARREITVLRELAGQREYREPGPAGTGRDYGKPYGNGWQK